MAVNGINKTFRPTRRRLRANVLDTSVKLLACLMEAKKIKQEAAGANAASADTGQDESNEFDKTMAAEDGAASKPATNGAVNPVRR